MSGKKIIPAFAEDICSTAFSTFFSTFIVERRTTLSISEGQEKVNRELKKTINQQLNHVFYPCFYLFLSVCVLMVFYSYVFTNATIQINMNLTY